MAVAALATAGQAYPPVTGVPGNPISVVYVSPMPDMTLRAFGWKALLIHGDPCVLDRWLWLRRHLRKGAVRTFDAGCGNGAFSIYAARCGNEVVAASFSPREQEDARRRAEILGVTGIQFRTIDLRELERHRDSLGSFDQIICFETIEHLTDDERLVRTLASMLAPGGQLLMTTPFEDHHPLFSEERRPSPVEDGSHVRYGYSRRRLEEIARGAGLEVACESFVSGLVSQKLTDLMRVCTARLGRAAGWAITLPLRPLRVFDRPLSRALRYPYLSVALSGVKP
jgi:SAM-dependent methyltransferase